MIGNNIGSLRHVRIKRMVDNIHAIRHSYGICHWYDGMKRPFSSSSNLLDSIFQNSNDKIPPMKAHKVSPMLKVTDPKITKPSYAETGKVFEGNAHLILLHGPESIERMSKAARIARRCLDLACSLVKPSVTTDEIDKAVHKAILAEGAYPSPLNYSGFPKSMCSSVNEIICHGIPDSRPLQYGDVVSFDVSCYIGGVHGDNCGTVIVGDNGAENIESSPSYEASPQSRAEKSRTLVKAAKEALDAGISVCKPGGCLSDIGFAIHDVVDKYGFDSVREYRGHGIGSDFHIAPYVKHFRNADKITLEPGMIFTIEPMVTEGKASNHLWSDGWTVATNDGGWAAQFEDTVLITDTGVEIITVPDL